MGKPYLIAVPKQATEADYAASVMEVCRKQGLLPQRILVRVRRSGENPKDQFSTLVFRPSTDDFQEGLLRLLSRADHHISYVVFHTNMNAQNQYCSGYIYPQPDKPIGDFVCEIRSRGKLLGHASLTTDSPIQMTEALELAYSMANFEPPSSCFPSALFREGRLCTSELAPMIASGEIGLAEVRWESEQRSVTLSINAVRYLCEL